MAATDRPLLVLAFAAACALLAGDARAEERASAAFFVHVDDDGLRVLRPSGTASVDVGDTRVGAHYEADVITAATVDVRTSASPRGFDERRHGASLSLDHRVGRGLTLGLGSSTSQAPDHRSYAGTVRAVVEDAERVHTVSVGLGAARDRISRAGDPDPSGHATTVGASVSWAAVLTRAAVADLSLAAERTHGDMESPYRFVPVTGPAGQARVHVAEALPDDRWRVAGRARLRWAPTDRLFTRASWRLHVDDWGIAGHTVRGRVAVQATERLRLSLDGRVYVQRGASFYGPQYATLPDVPSLRTIDRELAPMWQVGGGARVEHELGEWRGARFSVDARAELVRTHYFETPALRSRRALTTGLGIAMRR